MVHLLRNDSVAFKAIQSVHQFLNPVLRLWSLHFGLHIHFFIFNNFHSLVYRALLWWTFLSKLHLFDIVISRLKKMIQHCLSLLIVALVLNKLFFHYFKLLLHISHSNSNVFWLFTPNHEFGGSDF